jgi:hypothetical protein
MSLISLIINFYGNILIVPGSRAAGLPGSRAAGLPGRIFN